MLCSAIVRACIETGAQFGFDSTRSKGAILITKHKTIHEDVANDIPFKKYMLSNYRSWLAFANSDAPPEGYAGITVDDLIFVTGCDTTSDWAMSAFQSASRQIDIEFRAGVPGIASAHAATWGGWSTSGFVHRNCGPERIEEDSCSHNHGLLAAAADDTFRITPNRDPGVFDQCLFLRGWRIRRRPLARALRAGAGYHHIDYDRGPSSGHDGIHASEESDLDVQSVEEDDMVHTGSSNEVWQTCKPAFPSCYSLCWCI
jgi:hypothetical protein